MVRGPQRAFLRILWSGDSVTTLHHSTLPSRSTALISRSSRLAAMAWGIIASRCGGRVWASSNWVQPS